jgi:3-methyladenine DNA glycosylase/8-oxoguanine DNA glycosylase
MNLTKNYTKIIYPKKPYNFDATIYKPSHYPSKLNFYEIGKYWFVLKLKNRIYGIKMENLGDVEKPKIKICIFSDTHISKTELKEVLKELEFRFEFNKDISEFSKKFSKDKRLLPFIQKWRGMHGSCAQELYGLLMIGIFLQNTIVRRTVQMTNIMLENYGIEVNFDNKKIYAFWNPEDIMKISEEKLRDLKLGYRAKLLIKLSDTFIKEDIDEFKLRELPFEKTKKELLKLYGVGPETARILLHEAFHHYENFEHVSPWQQKILSKLLFNKKLVTIKKIINYVNKKYGKWVVLAVEYVWEDIFWQRKQGKKIAWLEKEIRL